MITKENKMKEMEYEEAPSGYVKLYNYKEPFMKFQEGFGYEGVLLFDGTTDKIQCHLCGQWLGSLPHHLAREHNMTAAQFKDKVGLRQTTALISESMRAKLIASGLDKRLQNLRAGGRIKSLAVRNKISQTLKANGFKREFQNEKGTCPEQIIERLLNLYKKEGKTPSSKKIPFYEAMIKVYGSYERACGVAGIPYNDPLEALKRGREKRSVYHKEDIINFMLEFLKGENRLPTSSDFYKSGKKNLYNSTRRKYSYEDLAKEAISIHGVYNSNLKGIRFGKESLIKFLQMFEKINGRPPSYSDAKRGLIPHLSRYSYNFGSWQNALKLAFKDNG